MIEAHLDACGVMLWHPIRITAYCPTSGDFIARSERSNTRYIVKRCALRDDNGGIDILNAMALCTNEDYGQLNTQEKK